MILPKLTTKLVALGTLVMAAVFAFAPISFAATIDVPYTSQAPLGSWSDPRLRDGCEEASILMAIMWESGAAMSPAEAQSQIIGMSDYEKFFNGFYQDTSAQDTANLMVQYFGYHNVDVRHYVGVADIKAVIDSGKLVIVPLNPRVISTKIYNRFTTRHTVVVTGYENGKIIFNDPMTGPNRSAPEVTFNRALQDYTSGIHINAKNRISSMIVVEK